MTTPEPLRLKSTAGRGVLFAAILASGMAFLDGTIVNVALPHIGADLDADVAGLQWTVNGYLLTLAAFVLLGGALGDRFGRKRVFLLGVLWFTVASVLCGIAPNIEFLIGARFLQGAGSALLTPGSLALIQASFRPEDRGKAIGMWSGLAGVSTALGPFLGGWLIDSFSWRWAFLINVPLALIAVLATLKWVPESRDPSMVKHFDALGAVLCAVGLGGITYALIEAPARGYGSVMVVGAALVGVAAAVAFVLVERRLGDAAMVPPSLFRSRTFTVLNIYTLAVYAALSGQGFFFAVQLQNVAGYSALATGLATLPFTILMLLLSARSGALAARIGPRIQLTVGPILAAVGLLLLRGVGADANYLTDVLPGVLLFALGLTTLVAPLTAAVLGAVDDRHAGLASGVNNAAARAGALLAIAALPLLVGLTGEAYENPTDLTAAYRSSLLWCVGLMLVGAVLAGLFSGRVRRRERHEPCTPVTMPTHPAHPVHPVHASPGDRT
jgi:EmrB/QacA subfamily drug resistance transporter